MAPSWSPLPKESTELVTQDGAESRMKSPVIQGIRHALARRMTMVQAFWRLDIAHRESGPMLTGPGVAAMVARRQGWEVSCDSKLPAVGLTRNGIGGRLRSYGSGAVPEFT